MIRDFPNFIDRSYRFLQYDAMLFCSFLPTFRGTCCCHIRCSSRRKLNNNLLENVNRLPLNTAPHSRGLYSSRTVSHILVNKANWWTIFFWYVYSFSVHVSGEYVPIIRRNNCIYATLSTCYSVWMTVWYAECIPDSHPYRITSTKCRINTVVSPDDGHIIARNM